MRKLIWLIPLTVGLWSCGSDDDGPSGVRYSDDLFTEVNTTLDIKYGVNAALQGIAQDLFIDVYEPADDNETSRPLLLLAHGGAFVSGTKTQIRDLCTSYAEKGYVVASMSYRLINDPTISDSVAYSEGVVLTLGDMKAAIRYLRNDALNANTYGIDPNMIIIGGVSAGAVMAMNVGFWDEGDPEIPDYLQDHVDTHGGFEGNSNDINVSSEVNGIISFSGSVFRDAWIDSNDPPIFMVHDELDPVVPCNYEVTNVVPFPILAYGACAIQDALVNANVSSQFLLIEGSDGHVSFLEDDDQAQEIIDESSAFMLRIINGEI